MSIHQDQGVMVITAGSGLLAIAAGLLEHSGSIMIPRERKFGRKSVQESATLIITNMPWLYLTLRTCFFDNKMTPQ